MVFCIAVFFSSTFTCNCLNPIIFFFQAEDGIRDGRVTGVQTCALPILRLAITGPMLVANLIQIAADNKDKSPVKPEELSPLITTWGRRTFSAVGISSQPMQEQKLEIGRASCRERVEIPEEEEDCKKIIA